jgi:hypothetical protein
MLHNTEAISPAFRVDCRYWGTPHGNLQVPVLFVLLMLGQTCTVGFWDNLEEWCRFYDAIMERLEKLQ